MELHQALSGFRVYLCEERRASPHTVDAYGRDLRKFAGFAQGCGCVAVCPELADLVPAYVCLMRQEGKAEASVARHVASIKALLSWAQVTTPFATPGRGSRAQVGIRPAGPCPPPRVLSRGDVDKLLGPRCAEGSIAIRDRAMLELLYATGLRVSELVAVSLGDVNVSTGYLRCRGSRERVVPVGRAACDWVRRYLDDSRPQLCGGSSIDELFVNHHGQQLTRQGFWKMLKRRAAEAGVAPDITPHTLRHSFAAHMVAGGADLRSIQEMLGHADIASTQRYADVARPRLAEVYEKAHPRAR